MPEGPDSIGFNNRTAAAIPVRVTLATETNGCVNIGTCKDNADIITLTPIAS